MANQFKGSAQMSEPRLSRKHVATIFRPSTVGSVIKNSALLMSSNLRGSMPYAAVEAPASIPGENGGSLHGGSQSQDAASVTEGDAETEGGEVKPATSCSKGTNASECGVCLDR